MRLALAIILGVGLLAAGAGLGQHGVEQNEARARTVSFQAIDVFIDSGAAPIAAYQIELRANDAEARVVGIEGGEHSAFEAPPHYDPMALHEGQLGERIVLAAFSTARELPTGRTRVARIHVQGSVDATYTAAIQALGSRDGSKIEGVAEVVPAKIGTPGDGR